MLYNEYEFDLENTSSELKKEYPNASKKELEILVEVKKLQVEKNISFAEALTIISKNSTIIS